MIQETNRPTGILKYVSAAVLLTIVFGGGCFMFFGQGKEEFLRSYLMGWAFWMMLALGCLGLTLLHHTVRGVWGLSTLRLYEAGGSWLSFLLLGFAGIPILANLKTLYHWTEHGAIHESVAATFKLKYLNEPAFLVRFVVYFVIWIGLSYWLRQSSLKQDETKETRLAQGRMNLSAPMLVVYFISVTLATTDWLMSLDVHWFSHIFGAWLLVGGVLTALALTNLIFLKNLHAEPYKSIVSKGLTKDLGNMMFVFTLLWAYTSVSQFIIIWQGNLTEFNSFYVARSTNGWDALSLVLIVGQFFIPFVLLMSPKMKAVPSLLAGMCVWILAMRLVDFYWIVAPFFRAKPDLHFGPDLISFAFVGVLWAIGFMSQLMQGSLVPTHDNRLQEAYHHA